MCARAERMGGFRVQAVAGTGAVHAVWLDHDGRARLGRHAAAFTRGKRRSCDVVAWSPAVHLRPASGFAARTSPQNGFPAARGKLLVVCGPSLQVANAHDAIRRQRRTALQRRPADSPRGIWPSGNPRGMWPRRGRIGAEAPVYSGKAWDARNPFERRDAGLRTLFRCVTLGAWTPRGAVRGTDIRPRRTVPNLRRLSPQVPSTWRGAHARRIY